MSFNEQTVSNSGGVKWAKGVADCMDPGAIDSQIQGYQSAASSIDSLQTTLQNVKNNLASSWTGTAATQAQQSFQGTINHAQAVSETINTTVIPSLQGAKQAQQDFKTAMTQVPDEQPVPSTSAVDSVVDFFTGSASQAQVVQAQNQGARIQAANAINKLSDGYNSSASQLGGFSGYDQPATPSSPATAFNLGPVSTGSGNGSASSYGQSFGPSGGASTSDYYPGSSGGPVSSGPGPNPDGGHTGTAGVIGELPPPPPTAQLPPRTTPPPASGVPPVEGGPVPSLGGSENFGGGSNVIIDESPGGSGLGGGESPFLEGRGNSFGGGGNGVFGETGFGNSDGQLGGGTGTGTGAGARAGNMSSTDSNSLANSDGPGPVDGSSTTPGEGGEGEGMPGQGMGHGGGGMGAGEEDLGSSRYNRGRYFDQFDDEQTPGPAPVRSVYEGATDAQGNSVNMTSGRRLGAAEDDEEDGRGKRPSYLKEDEFWNSAQRIVPPVIE